MKVDSKMEEALAYLESKEICPAALEAYSFAQACELMGADCNMTALEVFEGWVEDECEKWVRGVFAQDVFKILTT